MNLLVFVGTLMLTFAQSGTKADNPKYLILDDYIIMHNDGAVTAIRSFITKYYHPDDLGRLDMEKHIGFYEHIIKEFGPLNPEMYKIEEESATKLVVNLIKHNHQVSDKEIDPVDILQVEIDVHENNSSYLSRGLGLGALACSMRDNQQLHEKRN